MAVRKRNSVRKKPRYFYLNKELHRVLRVNRAEDLVYAWSYPRGKRAAYVWSSTQKGMQNAFSVSEVASFFGRNPTVIKKYIAEGDIPLVQKTYSLDARRSPGKYMFSEDDVRHLYDYLSTKNLGRPRKDGMLVQYPLPSRSELEAMIKQETILYMKDKAGQFAPIWKQPDW
jgi:hypothetical protein